MDHVDGFFYWSQYAIRYCICYSQQRKFYLTAERKILFYQKREKLKQSLLLCLKRNTFTQFLQGMYLFHCVGFFWYSAFLSNGTQRQNVWHLRHPTHFKHWIESSPEWRVHCFESQELTELTFHHSINISPRISNAIKLNETWRKRTMNGAIYTLPLLSSVTNIILVE